MHFEVRHVPWVPLHPYNHQRASLENDVTSFLVDTSLCTKLITQSIQIRQKYSYVTKKAKYNQQIQE